MPESTKVSASRVENVRPHVTLAVVFQVRAGQLQVLLWQRAHGSVRGRWSLPGGYLDAGRDARGVDPRHLAAKVDVRELSHLEQLETLQRARTAIRGSGSSRPPTSASSRSTSTRPCPRTRTGTRSTGCRRWRSTTARSCSPAASACAPSSRTRTSASRSRRRRSRSRELRDLYAAALGHDVSATNLQRVLRPARRPRGDRRAPRAGPDRRPAGRALPLPHAASSRSRTSSPCSGPRNAERGYRPTELRSPGGVSPAATRRSRPIRFAS